MTKGTRGRGRSPKPEIAAESAPTTLDAWIARAKDHPWVAGIVLLSVIVIGAANLSDAAARLWKRFQKEYPFASTIHRAQFGVYPGVFLYVSEVTKSYTGIGVMLNVEVTNLRRDRTRVQAFAADALVGGAWHRLGNIDLQNNEGIYIALDGDLAR